MPELFDLDRAFEALSDDVATHTHAPGAARATRAAGRRRTTRMVGAAAALAVVAGGGVGLIQHHTGPTVVDPADDMPAPAPLSVGVMDDVTAGWISGWTAPTSIKDVPSDLNAAGDDCMSSLLGDQQDGDVASYGASVFLSGHSIALSRGVALKTEAAAQRLMASADPASSCLDVRTTAPAPDTELITARASDANGHAVFAVARWHERLAFLGVSDPTNTDPAAVRAALGSALLAAIQDRSTVSVMSGIAGRAFQSGSASGSGSSIQPSYTMTGPTGAQLKQAFGSWAGGFDPNQGELQATSRPSCLPEGRADESGESVGNLAFVALSTYPSAAEASGELDAAATSLAGCGFRVEGSSATGALMATRDGGKPMTLWLVLSDQKIAWVQLKAAADPPQGVTDAVDQLLTTALATAKVDASGVSVKPPPAVMSASAGG
ncbi:MAG TPA: hypothetical protein VN088_02795 [Nocardioides sp.]|nr:hypothetical protein [Nocardioides sp.]